MKQKYDDQNHIPDASKMINPYSYENTIAKAASLANGLRLSGLYRVCENQKTISTKKLLAIVEKIHDDNKLDAIHLRVLANKLQAAQPQWLPIETAPKDGRTLLLGYFNSHGKWRTVRGQFMSDSYINEHWEDPDDVMPGWFETSAEADDVPNCWSIIPSHWMPLPELPEVEE